MLAEGAAAPVSSSVRVGCFCVFGPCPMKSALTGQCLVDPAVMDVERFGNRDRCSARREHFGLIGSAAARSGRPASGSHRAGGCRGPDQGGLGREHGVGSPRPGGPLSLPGLPDRRSTRGLNQGRKSSKVLRVCTICVSCHCTGPCWIVPRERENRVGWRERKPLVRMVPGTSLRPATRLPLSRSGSARPGQRRTPLNLRRWSSATALVLSAGHATLAPEPACG